MSIATDIATIRSAVVTAIQGGDYDTAIRQATAGLALLQMAPNTELEGAKLGRKKEEWSRDFSDLLAQCRKLKIEASAASGGPFQTTKVNYVRPPGSGLY